VIATAVSHYPKVGDGPGQQRLRQAIARLDRGEIDRAELDRVADEVTADVIAEQETAGLDLVTDGQVRWQDPLTYLCSRLGGFEITGLLRWFESNTYYRQPLATGPVTWEEPILVRDLAFAREHSTVPVKAVVTGPYTIATLSETRHHASHRDFVLDVARALNRELKALADAGPAWLQVDEPAIASNPSVRYRRDFDTFREAMHVLTQGVPGRLSLYVYHGGAADIPGLLELPFHLFGLDLVHGPEGWRLLEGWPAGKGIGLGVADARNVRMEDERELREALERGAAAAGEDNVHASPSCGLEFLPRDVAKAKLELLGRVVHTQEVTA
jgi:5-methyltetrahydropteroyltriglutamate--homocysteine methyltransferase